MALLESVSFGVIGCTGAVGKEVEDRSVACELNGGAIDVTETGPFSLGFMTEAEVSVGSE